MLKRGGTEARDFLADMEERQEDRTLDAYHTGNIERMNTHIEAADAFGWVIDLIDAGQLEL